MTEAQIFEKIKDMIVKRLSLKNTNINMNTHFVKDLGADSVDLMSSVMDVESAFSIEIPDDDLEGVETIGDVCRVVAKNI